MLLFFSKGILMFSFSVGNPFTCRLENDTPLVIAFLKQFRCTNCIHVERESVGLRINTT